jgi:hypothetical protein
MKWEVIIKTDDYDKEHHNKVRIGGEYWAENLEMLKSILEEFHKTQTAQEKTGHIPSSYATTSIIEHAIGLIDGWIKEDR